MQTYTGWPAWDDGREQRLIVSMSLSTLIVALALLLVRLPLGPDAEPAVSLLVGIVLDASAPAKVPVEAAERQQQPAESLAPDAVPSDGRGVDPGDAPRRDYDSVRDAAIQRYLDRLETPYGVNPSTDAKRREAAGRYQPPTREKPLPIWENVEQDQLGRTVLRSGDCYKVLDDPNVGSRAAFEAFGQYIAICTSQKAAPRELPWVASVRERYGYLDDPDGQLPGEAAE